MKVIAKKDVYLDVVYTETCGDGCCFWDEYDDIFIRESETLTIGNGDAKVYCKIREKVRVNNDNEFVCYRVSLWLIMDSLESGLFEEVHDGV